MLYSISELIYNKQIPNLPDGRLHITVENAKLFFLSSNQALPTDSLGVDLKRELEEYRKLSIPKETEEEWKSSIFQEIINHDYIEDKEYALDYMHLYRYLDSKEKKNTYFSLLYTNITRYLVNDARYLDGIHTMYRMLDDSDIDLGHKIKALKHMQSIEEKLGISANPEIDSRYSYFLKGLIPTLGMGNSELDEVLLSMIPDHFQYIPEVDYATEPKLYAYLFGIQVDVNYDEAYKILKTLLPELMPNKQKINRILEGINCRSQRDITFQELLSVPSELNYDELYFRDPDTRITLENAKRYYRYMNCSWFMIGKEYRERALELKALNIPQETFRDWKREYMIEKIHSIEKNDVVWNYVSFHSDVIYSKEESQYLFTRIRPVLEGKILYGKDLQILANYYDLNQPIELTGVLRSFVENGLKEETKFLVSYIKRCMKHKDNKKSPYLDRVKKSLKLVKL